MPECKAIDARLELPYSTAIHDEYVHFLDRLTWRKIHVGKAVKRAFQSATYVSESSSVIVLRGIIQSGEEKNRLNLDTVDILKVQDMDVQHTTTVHHMEQH